jgi:hypothetical protein
MDTTTIYDSGDIKKIKGKVRSHVTGNHGHYIFRIRTGQNPSSHSMGDVPIQVELHSSVSRKKIGTSWGATWNPAATTLRLSREETMHLVSGLLAALQADENS